MNDVNKIINIIIQCMIIITIIALHYVKYPSTT